SRALLDPTAPRHEHEPGPGCGPDDSAEVMAQRYAAARATAGRPRPNEAHALVEADGDGRGVHQQGTARRFRAADLDDVPEEQPADAATLPAGVDEQVDQVPEVPDQDHPGGRMA